MCQYNIELFESCCHARKVIVARCDHRDDPRHYTRYSTILNEIKFLANCPDCIRQGARHTSLMHPEAQRQLQKLEEDAKPWHRRVSSSIQRTFSTAAKKKKKEEEAAVGREVTFSLKKMRSHENVAFEGQDWMKDLGTGDEDK